MNSKENQWNRAPLRRGTELDEPDELELDLEL